MATKSYSKHKEFKEYSSSSSGNVPYTNEQFDMLKSELIPRGSKLDTVSNGAPGTREYHYEYKEEKHPSGKYDWKDLHTVEEYTIPPKSTPKKAESSSYYYEREERELPAITTGSRTYNYESSTSATPGYSKVKSTKVTKDLSQNVEELDSLLDDLQKDQERQLYKSGYTSDTAESTSFDYKRGTPVKAPSSGYSTLKREEVVESSSWAAPQPARSTELRQEMYREEKTESRVVPQVTVGAPLAAPQPVCAHCHHSTTSGTLSRSSTPMNKVTTTVKTYTYEVPAGQDPASVPLPPLADHQHTYVTSSEELRATNTLKPPPAGCQYCAHCNSSVRVIRDERTNTSEHVRSARAVDERERERERVLYPAPANRTTLLPDNEPPSHGPTSYKYTETSYSAHNSTQRFPPSSPSPAPFPRPATPSAGAQQPPKKLDDLLADFPDAKYPDQPDGAYRRKVEVSQESKALSRNTAGPAVYYPPGHTPFAKKPEAQVTGYQSSAMQGGGAYASGRGMYEYESGARSKEKHSERKNGCPRLPTPLLCHALRHHVTFFYLKRDNLSDFQINHLNLISKYHFSCTNVLAFYSSKGNEI
ncbi:hypothetical protein ACJJTC_005034 [Scirpophaga incertulas]